jgi:hypothetical protein
MAVPQNRRGNECDHEADRKSFEEGHRQAE